MSSRPRGSALTVAAILLLVTIIQTGVPALAQDSTPNPAPTTNNPIFLPFVESPESPANPRPDTASQAPIPEPTSAIVPVFETADPAKQQPADSALSGEESPAPSTVAANNAIRNLAGFRTYSLPRNDDGYTGAIALEFPLNYFGVTYTRIFVNNNGNVTLDAGMGTYTPFDLTSTSRPIIAPFFADVDTRGTASSLVTYGYDTVDGRRAFGVNWINVGYYSSRTDKLNSFQLVLIERPDTGNGNFDIEFNYDQILWETGSASGGSNGFGGYSARAGYSNGTRAPGTYYEFTGSAIPGSLLDSNTSTGLIYGRVNSSQNGRYRFFVRSGAVNNGLTVSPSTLPADGTSNAVITLGGATPDHTIQFISSLPGVIFSPVTVVANTGGAATTTIKSSAAGSARLFARDLSTGGIFATSANVVFTAGTPGQPTLPGNPSAPGEVSIVSVTSDHLLANLYPVGLGRVNNTIQLTVDWAGHPEGKVEFRFNDDAPVTVDAIRSRASKEFDFGQILREGSNSLKIRAISADGSASATKMFTIRGWTSESDWLRPLLAGLPLFNRNGLELELTFMFPGQPLGSSKIDFLLPGKSTRLTPQVMGKFTVMLDESRYQAEIGCRFYSGSRARGQLPCPKNDLFTLLGKSGLNLDATGNVQGRFSTAWPYLHRPDQLEFTLTGNATVFKQEESMLVVLNPIPGAAVIVNGLKLVPPAYDWVRDRGKFYFEVKPEVQGKMSFDWDGLLPRPSGSTAYIQLELEGGAKIDLFVAEGKVYVLGGGRIDAGVIPEFGIDKVKLFLALGYELKAGWFQASDRIDTEWTPYQRQVSASMASELLQQALGSQWRLIPRDFLTPQYGAYEEFSPAPASATFRLAAAEQSAIQSSNLFAANVFRYAEPDLALLDNKGLLVWTHDDPERLLGQGYDIRFSHWDGTTWSEPANLTNDTYPDSRPQVTWLTPQTALAVWQRLNDPALPISATLDLTQTRKFQLAWATYDVPSNQWSAPVWLTADAVANAQAPTLSRAPDGSIWLAWRSNPQGQLAGDAANPDRILAARWNGAGWDTAQVVAEAAPGLADLSMGHVPGQAVLTWNSPMTATGSLTPTLQLFVSRFDGSRWSAPQQITDSAQQHVRPRVVYRQGEPFVVWLADNVLTVQSLQNLQAAAFTLAAAASSVQSGMAISLSSDLQVDQFRVLQDSAGNLGAVFTGQRGPQRDLFLAYYDAVQAVWGNPRNLTADRAVESYPAAVLDSDDALLMAYSRTEVTEEERTATLDSGEIVTYTAPVEGRTDLYTLASTLQADVAVTALEVSNLLPVPGEAVTLTATVANLGDLPIVGLTYAWGDNDASFDEQSLSSVLVAGDSISVTTTYTPVVASQDHWLSLAVDSQNAIAESKEDNNLFQRALFGPDLLLMGSRIEPQNAEQYAIVTEIANIGAAAATSTTLAIEQAGVYTTQITPPLAPGQVVTLTLLQDYGSREPGSYNVVLQVNPEQAAVVEQDTANNVLTTTLKVGPDLLLDPLYLEVDSPLASTVVVTLAVFNNGNITSTEALVHFARRGDGLAGSRLASQPVPALAANQFAVITTNLPGPLGCGLYVEAEPGAGAIELTRINNAAYAEVERGRCAGFAQSATTAIAPTALVFTDTSSGDNTSWLWDFGDGATSTDRNPTHEYTAAGVYTVTLTVSGNDGADQYMVRDALTIHQAAVADFSASDSRGVRPLPVTFNNLSAGDIDTWQWDFGDGSTSSLSSPTYTYLQAGDYTVTLTVNGLGGTSIQTRTISVAPFGPPAQVQMDTGSEALTADGSSQAEIAIVVTDIKGNAVPGQRVDFTASRGAVSPQTTTTDGAGMARTVFTADVRSGPVTITAVAAGANATAEILLRPGAAASMNLAASPAVLPANGKSTSQVQVMVLDAFSNGVPGVRVNFATDAGTLSAAQAVSGEDGRATTTLQSERRVAVATVTASSGSLQTATSIRLAGGVVSGLVFIDINRNQTPDTNEPGLAGVTISLSDTANDQTATAQTDSNGMYLFEQTPPGEYIIVAPPENGFLWTTNRSQPLIVVMEGSTGPGFGAVWMVQLPHIVR